MDFYRRHLPSAAAQPKPELTYCYKKPLLRTVRPGASEKNHNWLRLVSGSEYRMASIWAELCRQVSFCGSPKNERAIVGSEYRMASIWIELCRQVSFCGSPKNERAIVWLKLAEREQLIENTALSGRSD